MAVALLLVCPNATAQSTAVSSVAPPGTVYDLEPLGKKPDLGEAQPLVDWLPIWGRDAREKGFDLPLPFGIALTYTYIHQNMVVSDVEIAGRPLDVTIRDAETTTHTGVFRADAWLFPFSMFTGCLAKPLASQNRRLFSRMDRFWNPKSLTTGSVMAGGMTVAGGWKAIFLTLDANWTTGDIVSKEKGQVGDKPIRSLTCALVSAS